MNLIDTSIIDKMQFGPPKGYLDIKAAMNKIEKDDGGITKIVVIASTMP